MNTETFMPKHDPAVHDDAGTLCTLCILPKRLEMEDVERLGEALWQAIEAVQNCSHAVYPAMGCLSCHVVLRKAMFAWRDRHVTPEEFAERRRLAQEERDESETL